ncbi:MAG: glutamate-cysteine ligase family protein, partial [Rubrobacteraceae bacterium]
MKDRRVGLEQELFLVDDEGVLSNRADEFLARSHELAEDKGQNPDDFAPECARSLVEVSTPPAASVDALADEYLGSLRLALHAARDLGLRLYPLATYPLPVTPDMRDELHYRIQTRTMGWEKFLHAGRCAGVHLHLEVAPGTIDSQVGVSYESSGAAREELLNVYNLATALDPAIIALTRSSPFYEGELQEVTARTAYYRGSPEFAPSGLYADLVAVGGLQPYAEGVENLVELQFSRYREWLAAMERAGVGRGLFEEAGDGLLDAAWNPVRLNAHGTVELRGIDGNYPTVVLGMARLITGAIGRVLDEGLTVKPTKEVGTLELDGRFLRVPDLEYVGKDLFRAAASMGMESLEVGAYIDSVLE